MGVQAQAKVFQVQVPPWAICGDCLFMRYGENVLEAQATRSGCAQSAETSAIAASAGWQVVGEGYTSVAHYLVLTQQACRAD
eukprot:SM000127S26673  [mRNA]  locus=s127:298443:299122:- [translate_table: standard]